MKQGEPVASSQPLAVDTREVEETLAGVQYAQDSVQGILCYRNKHTTGYDSRDLRYAHITEVG